MGSGSARRLILNGIRIFIALALAFALTGAMVVATVFEHADKASAERKIQSPS